MAHARQLTLRGGPLFIGFFLRAGGLRLPQRRSGVLHRNAELVRQSGNLRILDRLPRLQTTDDRHVQTRALGEFRLRQAQAKPLRSE